MSGETEQNVSGWTTDTLRSFFLTLSNERDDRYQQRFESQEKNLQTAITAQGKAIEAALASADRAVAKAETATEKRFEGVNEFRQQLADQARTFLPRQEYDARHTALSETLITATSRITALEGSRSGATQTIAWGAAAFGALIGVVAIVVSIVTR